MNEIATKPMENISSLITFQLGGELFCADMQSIVQIIDPIELQETDLNSANSEISLGNIKVPIVDLHKIAGFKIKIVSKDNRILVINIGDEEFCIWVEKVNNIYTIGNSLEIEIESNGGEDIDYLSGILNFRKQKMRLIDFKGLGLKDRKIS